VHLSRPVSDPLRGRCAAKAAKVCRLLTWTFCGANPAVVSQRSFNEWPWSREVNGPLEYSRANRNIGCHVRAGSGLFTDSLHLYVTVHGLGPFRFGFVSRTGPWNLSATRARARSFWI